MARLDRSDRERSNVLPFKPRAPRVHWLTVVNTVLILGLYLILLGN